MSKLPNHRVPRHNDNHVAIKNTLLALLAAIALALPAYAQEYDSFNPPEGGYWVCPNGEIGRAIHCFPPDFQGVGKWWEHCIPSRADCVHSETAVIGWRDMRVMRGPGYCYSGQPYTCARDGKWPP